MRQENQASGLNGSQLMISSQMWSLKSYQEVKRPDRLSRTVVLALVVERDPQLVHGPKVFPVALPKD